MTLSKRPHGRFRSLARLMRLDETDEPETEPLCGCRFDAENDTIQIADLGPGGVWLSASEEAFQFDRVYGPGSKRRDIHKEELRFMVDDALQGKDSALIVSGTSTSGKRHMVIGQPFISAADGAMSGLAERIVHDIYARDANEEWVLSVSMFSVFADAICDLLAPHGSSASLRLERGADGHVHVVNLSEVGLTTTADLLMLLRMSIRAREDMETLTSGRDARSTLVLTLKLKQVKGDERAQINLIDLSGAEQPELGGLKTLRDESILQAGSKVVTSLFGGGGGDEALAESRLLLLIRKYLEASFSVVVLSVASPISVERTGMREGLALADQAREVYARSHPGGMPRQRSDSTGAPATSARSPAVSAARGLNEKMVEVVQYLVEQAQPGTRATPAWSNFLAKHPEVNDFVDQHKARADGGGNQDAGDGSTVSMSSVGRKITAADLCEAAASGDIQQLRMYAALGANLGLGDYDQRTALHLAASEGLLAVVQFMVDEAQVDHSPLDRWGGTPLDDAVRSMHADVMEYLAKKGAKRAASIKKVTSTDLCDAASKGDTDLLREYKNGGVDLNLGDYDQRTALHLAASEGLLAVVKFLVEEGAADHSPLDRWGGTPLDDAIRQKHQAVAEYLSSAGGQRAAVLKGATAVDLCEAASRGDVEQLQFYASLGTDMNLGDYDQRTALHLAASEGLLAVVQFLVAELHADHSPVDRWGGTPLDDAIRHDETHVVEFLESQGAQRGKTAVTTAADAAQRGVDLCEAASSNNMDVLRALIAQGGDANVSDYDSRTALHLAASNGHLEIVAFLIEEAGSSVSPIDRWLGTPLDDAIRAKHTRVMEYLKSKGAERGRKGVTLDGRTAIDDAPGRAMTEPSNLAMIVERISTRQDDGESPEPSVRFTPTLEALIDETPSGILSARGARAQYGDVIDASQLPVVRAAGSRDEEDVSTDRSWSSSSFKKKAPPFARAASSEVNEEGALNTARLREARRLREAEGGDGGGSAGDAPAEGEGVVLHTLHEAYFKGAESGGKGTQIDAAALELFAAQPPSLDEAGKGGRHRLVTTTAPEAAGADGPLAVPALLRGSDARQLCLRPSFAPEARNSHVLAADLPKERVALLALIDAIVNEPSFWEKRKQTGKGNAYVVLAHNTLVRIRRYHRLLEDTEPAELPAAEVDALLRMHELCALAASESTVSAVYNQAVKAVGEFYCYARSTPPLLEAANVPKRGAAGSADALIRSALAAMFNLLIKGYIDDATRGAIREAVRCVAASLAPPALLCDVALDAMVDNLKYRDVFAVRTRELGLTIAHLVLHRNAFASVRRFFEQQDRATGQPSKMHTLVACVGMAHSEGARSALNRALANGIAGALRTHIGLDSLHEIISTLKLERNLATDLLTAAATAPALDPLKLRPPPNRRAVGGTNDPHVEYEDETFTLRSLSPHSSANGAGPGSGSIPSYYSDRRGAPLGLPMCEVLTLREAVFINDGAPVTQILPSTLLLLKALPASAIEIATDKAKLPDVTAPPKEKFGLQVPAARALRSAEPVALCLRANTDARSHKSHVLCDKLPAEREAILALAATASSTPAFWSAKSMAGSNAPAAALVHNSLVRARRALRLLEDTRPAELDAETAASCVRMLEWATTVLQQATLAAHTNHALKLIGEYFCMKYVPRPSLQAANTGKHAVLGSAGYSVQQCISMVFYSINRDDKGGTTAYAVRETLRCIICSEAPSLILVDCALEAMTTNLKGRDHRALAVREMCLTAIYLVLARRDWLEVKSFFSSADRTTGLPQRTCVVVTAMAYALWEADKSPLNNTLVTRLAVVLHRHLGNRFADVVRLAQLDKGMTDALIRLAGIDEDLLRSRRKSRRGSRRRASGVGAKPSKTQSTRDFFGSMTRKMSRGDVTIGA